MPCYVLLCLYVVVCTYDMHVCCVRMYVLRIVYARYVSTLCAYAICLCTLRMLCVYVCVYVCYVVISVCMYHCYICCVGNVCNVCFVGYALVCLCMCVVLCLYCMYVMRVMFVYECM